CNYSYSAFNVEYKINPSVNFNGVMVELKSQPKNSSATIIHTETDAGIPITFYDAPFLVTSNVKLLLVAFPMPNPTMLKLEFNKATGKKIILKNPPSPKYQGDGAFTLVNGIKGDLAAGWSGNEWLGFLGNDLEATIDLGANDTISKVTAGFLTDKLSWIHPPKTFEVLISQDGNNFKSVGKIKFDTNNSSRTENTIEFNKTVVRYVKVIADPVDKIPEGNPGVGKLGWLFVDEISIE
ncbi:MAG: discoidin domain-containing protein, partial [Chitinophagales bacterium]